MRVYLSRLVRESDMTDMKKVAAEFSAYMCGKFGAKVVQKETSDIMKAVATGFDLARTVGTGGLASGADFLSSITTTLGDTIYMPDSVLNGDPLQYIEILTHEIQHVIQFHASSTEFLWLYATESEARVKYETDAYDAGTAILVWLTGTLDVPATANAIVDSLVGNYHLQQADADLADVALKSHLVSLKNGIVTSQSGREAIAWFEAHYPSLKGNV